MHPKTKLKGQAMTITEKFKPIIISMKSYNYFFSVGYRFFFVLVLEKIFLMNHILVESVFMNTEKNRSIPQLNNFTVYSMYIYIHIHIHIS